MKKICIGLLLCVGSLFATVYENAEDSSVNRWTVSDNLPVGATITNIVDVSQESRVINLQGASYDNKYTIGGLAASAGGWNEQEKRYLTFSIKNEEGFLVDIILETTSGLRYLRYSDDINQGIDNEYINIGLGYSLSNGQWHKVQRDLSADLKILEPNNEIIAIHGLEVRGNCKIDNIEVADKPSTKEFVIYEDAEDGKINRWAIVDNLPAGATVSNVLDSDLNSKVIKLQGTDSYENRYELTNIASNAKNLNFIKKEKIIISWLVMVLTILMKMN
ncbi:MAG TPA: hypothetical protein EYG94_00685 [Campylobacterales bacterium]|nr:hypothetical protein [Campylobacterales bacterium]